MCCDPSARWAADAAVPLLLGGRWRVLGLSTRLKVCGRRPGMEAREARIHGSMEMRCGQRILIQRI